MHRLRSSIFRIIISIIFSGLAFASIDSPVGDSETLVAYLTQSKADLVRATQDSSVLMAPSGAAQLQQEIKQNEALIALVHAKIASLDDFLVNQRQSQKNLAYQTQKATLSLAQQSNSELKDRLAELGTQNETHQKVTALIIENLALAHRYEHALLAIQSQLLTWHVKQQGERRYEALQQQIDVFRQERSALYQKNVTMQRDKNSKTGFKESYDDALSLQLNNQHIARIHFQIAVLELQMNLVRVDDALLKQQDIKTIASAVDAYKEALAQLHDIQQSLSKWLGLLKEEQKYVLSGALREKIQWMQHQAERFQAQIVLHQKTWTEQLDNQQQALKKQLSVRQTLAGYSVNLDRVFMLFIFVLAIVMWVRKDIFPLLLRPVLKTRKRYFRKAIALLFVLLPLTLFTTAMMGLVGYVNLAWSMSRYQVYVVVVIIGYVIVRGLLADAVTLISERMLSSMRNGWLWTEVFLKPLDNIIHLVLFLTSVVFLCQLFGVYTEMPVVDWLKHTGQHELIGVSGVHITFISVIEFFMVVSIFVWAAKWTREFGYRWLYRSYRDEGVRNSLSVFTQYGVVLVGGYITLRVLGLDFSGMSVVIGGLAVGMGFGLRDFASNIVGGIMLLIERPVREGDLITLGDHEGRVAHIGIRSMRVSSWDNTEVLIPNAETFNKPFINWTHQDNVVRTVVPIKVSRDDDPVLIQRLIFEVLDIIPEILSEPPTQVLLTQIDAALIDFEVRYFINIRQYTRFEIRSKFLFALTAQFKAAGITAPIPPLTVEIKEFPHDVVIRNQTPED